MRLFEITDISDAEVVQGTLRSELEHEDSITVSFSKLKDWINNIETNSNAINVSDEQIKSWVNSNENKWDMLSWDGDGNVVIQEPKPEVEPDLDLDDEDMSDEDDESLDLDIDDEIKPSSTPPTTDVEEIEMGYDHETPRDMAMRERKRRQ